MFRGILDNVLSGMKAGFKAILNLEHPIERKKMFNQKGSSKLSATLLALILGASVFMAGQVWAAKYVTDPSTGKVVSAPQYGGTLTYPYKNRTVGTDPFLTGHLPSKAGIGSVNERLAWGDWGIARDKFDFRTTYLPDFAITGQLAESWDTPAPLTYIFHIRQGVHWHDKPPMNGRGVIVKSGV